MHNHQNHSELDFTGERMIPKLNQGQAFYFEHLIRYLMAAEFIKGKTVLDVGSGSGYGSWILKNRGAKSVKGVDVSKESVKYAGENYGSESVNFEFADAQKLPVFKNKFDVITAFELIEHIENQKGLLEGVRNNLVKNGLFLVSTPNKLTYKNETNHFHINELTPDEFNKLLKKYFKHVYLFDQRFLFSNLIIPIHSKGNVHLEKLNEDFVTENIESFLPVNKLEDTKYLVAICSDIEIKNFKNFSISAFDVDIFSLKEGMEGLYQLWFKSNEENNKAREKLNELMDSKFFKLWQIYCKFRDAIFLRR